MIKARRYMYNVPPKRSKIEIFEFFVVVHFPKDITIGQLEQIEF